MDASFINDLLVGCAALLFVWGCNEAVLWWKNRR